MKYSLRIHSSCIEDLINICNWYDERHIGLGDDFESGFDALISLIMGNPLGYQVLKKNIHRAVMDSFPYSVFYFIDEQTIIIIGVLHHGRSRKQWGKIVKRR